MRLAVVLALLVATPVFAHDFFLSPSTHRLEVGAAVSIVLHVGYDLDMEEHPRSNTRIVRFEAHLGNKVQAVEGKHGTSPAGRVAFDEPGVATIVYQSTHSDVELDGPKFKHYLEEEGLEDIIAERAKLGVEASPGRESYARYAKALVTVGDGNTGWDRRVGLPSELVAVTDPRAGGTAQFQLFYEDKPKANARVDILRIEKKRLVSVGHARTDADGKVSLAIPSNGAWVVATTLMRAMPQELGLEGDWESFWTSIEFESGKTVKQKRGGCSTGDPGGLGVAFAVLAWLLSARRAKGERNHEDSDRDRIDVGVVDGPR